MSEHARRGQRARETDRGGAKLGERNDEVCVQGRGTMRARARWGCVPRCTGKACKEHLTVVAARIVEFEPPSEQAHLAPSKSQRLHLKQHLRVKFPSHAATASAWRTNYTAINERFWKKWLDGDHLEAQGSLSLLKNKRPLPPSFSLPPSICPSPVPLACRCVFPRVGENARRTTVQRALSPPPSGCTSFIDIPLSVPSLRASPPAPPAPALPPPLAPLPRAPCPPLPARHPRRPQSSRVAARVRPSPSVPQSYAGLFRRSTCNHVVPHRVLPPCVEGRPACVRCGASAPEDPRPLPSSPRPCGSPALLLGRTGAATPPPSQLRPCATGP